MRRLILFFLFFSAGFSAYSQETATWQFEQKKATDGMVEIVATATIIADWYMYSLNPGDGPMPTAFTFSKNTYYELVGSAKESIAPKEKYDEGFQAKVKVFEGKAVFVQKIRPLTNQPFTLDGSVSYQTCSGSSCLMGETEFSVQIPARTDIIKEETVVKAIENPSVKTISPSDSLNQPKEIAVAEAEPAVRPEITPAAASGDSQKSESMWGFILAAILAGLGCVVTPCVFPMIPMTVGFFVSGSKNRAQTIGKALVFWLSVGLVYGLVGCIIAIFKSDSFAQIISTHWVPNLLFALMFIVFAASFFGMFEIVLPNGLANKADRQVDKGGFVASFFMAIVLAIVSFSCTGPFVGSLISEAVKGSAVFKPILGFVCFGLALASPFLIFAIFPSIMKKLPKSGGWLNSVKVVFAFVMLGFSLKFLIQVETFFGWNLISREVGIGFWIVLAILLGIYILGKIKFSHDSDVPHVTFFRLILAIAAFTFAIYLVPGLFGSELEGVSAFIPSKDKQAFDLTKQTGSMIPGGQSAPLLTPCGAAPKYEGLEPRMALPHGIPGYYDLKEALACAKSLNRPVIVDFTGIFCSNCKKMKAGAFTDQRVIDLINKEFVFVALYTDVKTVMLPAEEQTTSRTGRAITTIGEWNAEYQLQKFDVRSQPYLAVIDGNENILAKGLGLAGADELLQFLNQGLDAFKAMK